jgi:hypothetical protein
MPYATWCATMSSCRDQDPTSHPNSDQDSSAFNFVANNAESGFTPIRIRVPFISTTTRTKQLGLPSRGRGAACAFTLRGQCGAIAGRSRLTASHSV